MTAGVDSNIISSIANKKIETYYNVTFKGKKYDESDFVKRRVKALKKPVKFINGYDGYSIQNLKKALWHLESGHSSKSILSYLKLTDEVSKNYKVMLEGQGADEVFAGYFDKLIIPYSIELIKKRKLKNSSN